MWATMHGIMKPSILLVALILIGLGKEVLGQMEGVTGTSVSEEGGRTSSGPASVLKSALPAVTNDTETAMPVPDTVSESTTEAVQQSESSTMSLPEVTHAENEMLAEAEKRTESPTTVPSTPAKSVTDPKSCNCTCPPVYEILTTVATTTSDVTSTEKSESAEFSTKSFREDHLSRKGTSFFVKAVVAFVIMAAIFGILIVVNLCRRHRGDISAQLREWKDNARGRQHVLGFCSRCSCCGKSTGSTPIITFRRGKYGEEDSDLDILTESMHM